MLAIPYFWDRFFLPMKIRISENGVRLRLSVEDVHLLQTSGVCALSIALPGNTHLHYMLRQAEVEAADILPLTHGRLEMLWPQNDMQAWCIDPERVGLYADIATPDGTCIALAIEKDFACNPDDEKNQPGRYFPRPKSSPAC